MKNSIIIENQLVSYYVIGEIKSRPLVFLHGWSSRGTAWQDLAEKLRNEGFCCYLLDFPGFGDSPMPKKDFTVGDYAQIIDGFIKKLGLNNIILIGHSFGGRIAIKLASRNPEYIKKIILVDSAGIKQSRGWLIPFLAKIGKPFFKPKFIQRLKNKIYKAIGSADYIESGKLKQIYLNTINEDLTPLLSQIKKPALIIWGENDKETPIKYAKIINLKISNSQLEIIKEAEHYSFLDNPEEFLKVLIRFLK